MDQRTVAKGIQRISCGAGGGARAADGDERDPARDQSVADRFPTDLRHYRPKHHATVCRSAASADRPRRRDADLPRLSQQSPRVASAGRRCLSPACDAQVCEGEGLIRELPVYGFHSRSEVLVKSGEQKAAKRRPRLERVEACRNHSIPEGYRSARLLRCAGGIGRMLNGCRNRRRPAARSSSRST